MNSAPFSVSESVDTPFADLHRKLEVGGLTPFILTLAAGAGALFWGRRSLGAPKREGTPVDWEHFLDRMVHPDDAPLLRAGVENVLAGSQVVLHQDYRVRSKKAGGWAWLQTFGTVDWRTPDGTIRVSGLTQNLSGLSRRAAVSAQERALDALVAGILDCPYLILREGGEVLRRSAYFTKHFGMKDEFDLSQFFGGGYAEVMALFPTGSEDDDTDAGTDIRLQLEKNDASKAWYRCSFTSAAYNSGRCLVCLFTDISAEVRVEQALKTERARNEVFMEASGLGTWEYSGATRSMNYSRRWSDIYGMDPNEIEKSPTAWEDYVNAEDKLKIKSAVAAHLAGLTPYYEARYRIQRKDGRVLYVRDHGRVIDRPGTENWPHMVGGLQDITALKEAEDELLHSKIQLNMISTEVGIGLWSWNVADDKVSTRVSIFTHLGYGDDELPQSATELYKFVHPDDLTPYIKALKDCAASTVDSLAHEFRVKRKNGNWEWLFCRGLPVEWDKHGYATQMVGGIFNIQAVKESSQKGREALATITRQKLELEDSVAKRTRLLHSVQQRLQAILADGNTPGGFAGDPTPSAGSGDFEEGLNQAFDTITGIMWWYKCILESTPNPIIVTDNEGRCTYMNPAGLETAGASHPAEVLGKECLGGVSGPCLVEHDAANRMHVMPPSFTFYHQRLKRHFRGLNSFLYDPEGRRSGAIEVLQDITEARAADERARIMLDTLPLSCLLWDADCTPVDCNMVFCNLLEAPDKDVLLRDFARFSPVLQPDGSNSRESIDRLMRQAFAEGRLDFFWEHTTYSGDSVPVQVTLHRVPTPTGFIVVGYIEDLRSIRAKEEELHQERGLLRNVMESSPVCFVIRVGNSVRFATPYAERFFGMRPGANLRHYFSNPAEYRALNQDLRDKGAVNWVAASMRSAGGVRREMLVNAFVAEYYGEPCVMSWFLDVTEMRDKERELSQAKELAEESTKAKSSFLANMSHEIRTPMNAVLGMTRLVLDTTLSTVQRERLENVERSARALLRILNDILDFSKIEAGKLELECLEFDPRRELERIVNMSRPAAQAKGLYLNAEVALSVPSLLHGDTLRISQVLTNLLSNAVKFTASGGVDVQMTAEHRAGEVLVRYVVRDTGIGIEESQVGNLFSAFTQADSSTTRSYGGTGLGLAISHRLAEIMGGDLWFSGGPGGPGAEFTFTVPLSVVTRQSTGGKPSATCAPPALTTLPARLKGARVLLAEDNDINRIIARELLEKVGFAVDEAVDGAEAVEKAKHTAYAAIFMDIQMPRMDGFAATSALRRIKKLKNLPIIALTAHAMVGDKEKSLAAGMNAHLTKPLDEEELCRTVVQLMPDAAAPEQAVPRRGKTRRQTPAPHEKVVDLELGLRRVGDKRELLFRLLERLSRECPGILSSLAEHLREGRWEQAALVAHTLKGSAANLGAEPLRAAASTLDNAIRLGDGASTLALQADLEREMARFSAAVAAAVSLKD